MMRKMRLVVGDVTSNQTVISKGKREPGCRTMNYDLDNKVFVSIVRATVSYELWRRKFLTGCGDESFLRIVGAKGSYGLWRRKFIREL